MEEKRKKMCIALLVVDCTVQKKASLNGRSGKQIGQTFDHSTFPNPRTGETAAPLRRSALTAGADDLYFLEDVWNEGLIIEEKNSVVVNRNVWVFMSSKQGDAGGRNRGDMCKLLWRVADYRRPDKENHKRQ